MTAENEKKIIYTGPSRRGFHRLQLAAECLQRYAWSHRIPKDPTPAPEGIKSSEPKSPALARGSLMHLALAQHYARIKAKQEGTPVDAWCEPEEAVRLIAKLEKCEEHVDDILKTYEAYQDRFWGDEQEFRVIGVEMLQETMIADKYLFTGRFDLIIEDMVGRIWVIDHKSTGFIKAAQKEFYAVSGQLIGYGHMAREKYGAKYAGMKVNLVQVGQKPAFERINLSRSPFLEQNFVQFVVDTEESIERMDASGRNFDNWPKAMNEMTCYGRYGACNFIEWCKHGYGAKKGGNWTWNG